MIDFGKVVISENYYKKLYENFVFSLIIAIILRKIVRNRWQTPKRTSVGAVLQCY